MTTLFVILFILSIVIAIALYIHFSKKTNILTTEKAVLESQNQQLQIEISSQKSTITTLEQDLRKINEELQIKLTELSSAQTQIDLQTSELKKLQNDLLNIQNENKQLNTENASYRQKIQNLEELLAQQKEEMTQLHQKLQKDFEIITNKLLEQSTQKLSEQNLQVISNTISPIKEYLQQVKDLEQKIQRYYDTENKERSSLKTIIEELTKRSDEVKLTAERLANALTTEVKNQGNWGELILERILELSGLEEGREYTIQKKFDDKNPDVIINLPDNKHIIIDSKVTLNALIDFQSAQSEEEKKLNLKRIIESIQSHINNLSSKDYEKITNLYSVDFVLMFIPIESVFSIIQQYKNYQNEDIFSYAIRKRIIIVTPTSLIATLKTIYFIWQQEKRRKDFENILSEIEKLYDKLRTFTDYFADLEKALQQAQKKFNDAKSSLMEGKGNAMSIIENKIKPYINPKKPITNFLPKEDES